MTVITGTKDDVTNHEFLIRQKRLNNIFIYFPSQGDSCAADGCSSVHQPQQGHVCTLGGRGHLGPARSPPTCTMSGVPW